MITKLKGVLKGVLPLWEIKKYINKKSLWHEARKQKNAEVEFTLPDREFFPWQSSYKIAEGGGWECYFPRLKDVKN